MIVEIYPRVFAPEVRKSDWRAREEHVRAVCRNKDLDVSGIVQGRADANDDAFDAFISTVGMWRELRRPRRGFRQFDEDFYADPVLRSEGWIWGLRPR